MRANDTRGKRSTQPLRRERNGPRSRERLREAGEHREVGVEPDACEAAVRSGVSPYSCFKRPNLALDWRAAPVETLPLVRPVGDAVEHRMANQRQGTRFMYRLTPRTEIKL